MTRMYSSSFQPLSIDLSQWSREPEPLSLSISFNRSETLAAARRVSVIVPTRNEQGSLADLIPQLLAENPHEILIADGGNSTILPSFADYPRVSVIPCPPRRARQMKVAAPCATGEYLLFLHADTIPPAGF